MILRQLFFLILVCLILKVVAQADSNCSFPIPSIQWSSPVPERNTDGLFSTLQGKCLGGKAALLTTGLRLTYEIKEYNLVEYFWINYNSSVPAPNNCSLSDITKVSYLFVQPEHGGEYCHCFQVVFNWSNVDTHDTRLALLKY